MTDASSRALRPGSAADEQRVPTIAILFVGDLWQGSTALHRCEALQNLGHSVESVNATPVHGETSGPQLFLNRVRSKLFRMGVDRVSPRDLANVNVAIDEKIRQRRFDMIWIDKGRMVEKSTLAAVKAAQPWCKIVGYSPDDMNARDNQSRQFLEHLPLYDLYFTTKSYGVSELKALGCRDVRFVGNAFQPEVHRPREVTGSDRERLGGVVGFIGEYEAARAASMAVLAAAGIPVRVWGLWREKKIKNIPNLQVEHRAVWNDEYARAVCCFDINLGFLRKANRDLQTTRSVEIPACGGFLLAERTREHLELFDEGREAEFFSSNAELLEKVKYYLDNPEKRRAIASAGRQRCLLSGYSNVDRLRKMVRHVLGLRDASVQN